MGAYDPDLILETGDGHIRAHSQMMIPYCAGVAAALAQSEQLERDPDTGLPIIPWRWPQIPIPVALDPGGGGAVVPESGAVHALLHLCYGHHWYADQTGAPLPVDKVELVLGHSSYNAAVLAVLARDLGWAELHRVLDGMLAKLPARVMLEPDVVAFARQVGLEATLRAAVRQGVVLYPARLESAGGFSLAEISDTLLSWPAPAARFIDLIRCAAKIDLDPEQIADKARHDPHFVIIIEGTDRLAHLLQWLKVMNVWGADFWQGWFSRFGYSIVERIRIRRYSPEDQDVSDRLLQDLRSIMTEIIKNELICIPNLDPLISHCDLAQPVPLKRTTSHWKVPFW